MNFLGYRLYFSTYKNVHFVHDCKKNWFNYLQKQQINANKNRVFGCDTTYVFCGASQYHAELEIIINTCRLSNIKLNDGVSPDIFTFKFCYIHLSILR